MIGCAAAVMLLINGRIMGASGILGGVVEGASRKSVSEYAPFLIALVGVPALAAAIFGAPQAHVSDNLALLVVAGMMVGFGTRMANGCTSGHGVCGIPRFSLRSIVATLIYLAAGMGTYFIARHIIGVI